jgi:hypothetical protein
MFKSDIMGKKPFDTNVEAATVASCTKVLGKIQAAIAEWPYMAF